MRQALARVAIALWLGGTCCTIAHAKLVDRGNGLVYDNVLDVTWLQNADLAATAGFGVAGISADGVMRLAPANAYIAALNAAHYKGFSDWRLPLLKIDAHGLPDVPISCEFETESTCRSNELGYMYYHNLGGSSIGSGEVGTKIIDGVTLLNIRPSYWSGDLADLGTHLAPWYFQFTFGHADIALVDISNWVWPVRSGDVFGMVPEPNSALTLSCGVLIMISMLAARRRRRVSRI